MTFRPRSSLAALALALTACSSGAATTSTSAPSTLTSASTTAPTSSAAASTSAAPATSSPSPPKTRWNKVVVLVMENRDETSIIGNPDAPYLNTLAKSGLNLTDMHGEAHPSEPNYIAMLSGSTQGLTDDSCPHTYRADDLAHQVAAAGYTFTGYSDGLPHAGATDCVVGDYARRHAPWVSFANVPASSNQPFTAFPTDYTTLPSLSYVIPNLQHDMHDGTVAEGDAWVREHLGGYVTWARAHGSLLLVTWDEDENTTANHIATFAVGAGVTASTWTKRADHYTLLATLEDAFGVPRLGKAASRSAIAPLG